MSSPRYIAPVFYKLNGGLNRHDHFATIDDNEAETLINFDLSKNDLRKRAGAREVSSTLALGSGTGALRLIGQYYIQNSIAATYAQSGLANGSIYYSTDGGTTWGTCLDGTFGTLLNLQIFNTVQYGDKLYGHNLDSFMFHLGPDISLWTGATDTPGGITGDVVNDYLFCWAPTTQVIRFSQNANPNVWPGDYSYSINQIGGQRNADEIVALVGFKDKLVIFKQNSIWITYMTGSPANWSTKLFVDGIGATSLHAITKAEDYIYFIGQRGVYRTNLSTLEEISTKIDNPFPEYLFKDRGSIGTGVGAKYAPSLGSQDKIAFWNKKIFCTINISENTAFGAQTYRHFIFYTDREIWSEVQWASAVHVPYNYIVWDNTRGSSGTDNLFKQGLYWGSINNTPQKVFHWKEDNPQFDAIGSEYVCQVRTKRFEFDDFTELLKKIPYIFLKVAAGADVLCNIFHNGTLVDTIPVGSFSATQGRNFRRPGPGYVPHFYVTFQFISSGADRDVIVAGVGFGVREPRPYVPDLAGSA